MKKITYLLGLLSITIPSRSKAQYRDSMGNGFVPYSIKEPMPLNTTLPQDVNTWEQITPDMCNNWLKELNVSKTHTRFAVTPLSDGIIKTKKLVLDNVL